jgi:hypothetical protein
MRSIVLTSRLRSLTSAWNCFGLSSRDIGQRRDPAPPHRMTGVTVSVVLSAIRSCPASFAGVETDPE